MNHERDHAVAVDGAGVEDLVRDVTIAIIGGTGLYSLEGLKVLGEVYPETPWGYPSAPITISQTASGNKVAFLARHGKGHAINPSEVPVRANIAALKHIGVRVIVAFSAVGSLQLEMKPRDFVLPDQIIDRTKGIRPSTFFESGLVAHCSFSHPFDEKLAGLIFEKGASSLQGDNVKMHKGGTLIVMEGPAFSTRAESNLYRSWGGSIINMSALPEAKLAREAEIHYQMVCMSTDYDCWHEDEEPVTVEAVVRNLNANSANAKNLLNAILPALEKAVEEKEIGSELAGSMKWACVTAPEVRSKEALKKIEYILPGVYA
ncbi:nucleoside phosphorylase domain-containing protein [Hyaloraphidium curvatum]|nr:nucleoside phosphorylase domain-containing protein [Hyaloraphidium curvatum]